MKTRLLTKAETLELVAELRTAALLPAGPAPDRLRRAKEIRFLLESQPAATPSIHEKADEAYRLLEILLSHRRWRDYPVDLDHLRKSIKSACDRLRVAVGGRRDRKGAA